MEILLVVLSALAGRYVELPAWQVILFLTAAVWAAHQLNRDWENEEQDRA